GGAAHGRAGARGEGREASESGPRQAAASQLCANAPRPSSLAPCPSLIARAIALRRKILELRVLAEERQLDHAGRAIALLADDDLGEALVGGILVVVLVAIDE